MIESGETLRGVKAALSPDSPPPPLRSLALRPLCFSLEAECPVVTVPHSDVVYVDVYFYSSMATSYHAVPYTQNGRHSC
jgi:hypothetical protein